MSREGIATVRTARQALNQALADEMERDPSIVVLGETVQYIGATGIMRGLYDRFGPSRVIETPVSENAIFGAALGLALKGLRPVVEIYSADFLLAVANEVMNDIPKWRQQQAMKSSLPITIRGWMGANGGLGPEHSQSMEPFFHHAPGLRIVTPGSAEELPGLLRASIRDDDPVLFFEHRKFYDLPVSEDIGADPIPLDRAAVAAEGGDITIVAWGWMAHLAREAAAALAQSGVSAEVIDVRTVRPLDMTTILASADKTRRLLVVEEAPRTGSVAAEIIAATVEGRGPGIDAARVTMQDLIHPYSARLEERLLPTTDDIVQRALSMMTTEN